MRFGRASPGRSASRRPARVLGRGGARLHAGDIDRQLQREMREHMADHARDAPPFSGRARARRGAPFERIRLVEVVDPLRRRHLGHAAEQPLGRPRCAAARSRRRAGARRQRRAAAALPASVPCVERSAGRRAGAPHNPPSRGTARRRASPACRWSRRDPSAPARNPRCGTPAPATAPADGCRPWRPAARLRPRTAAPPPARHCRRPGPCAPRTRSPQSQPRCSARYRAARPAQPPCSESHRAPPPPARRHAGCGRARNSRARPTVSARRRAAPRPARPRPASVRGTARNRARPPSPWSAAA